MGEKNSNVGLLSRIKEQSITSAVFDMVVFAGQVATTDILSREFQEMADVAADTYDYYNREFEITTGRGPFKKKEIMTAAKYNKTYGSGRR